MWLWISQYMLCNNSLMLQALFIQIQLPQGSKFQQFSGRHLMWTNHSPFHQPHFKWKSIHFQFQNQYPSFRTLFHQLILQVSSSPWFLYLMYIVKAHILHSHTSVRWTISFVMLPNKQPLRKRSLSVVPKVHKLWIFDVSSHWAPGRAGI